MIYTSYFANLKNVKNPISICAKAPVFYKGPQYKKLAPKYGFFMDWKDGIITNDGYVVEYNKQVLQQLNVDEVIKELREFYPNEDFTLICYEKPEDFCHRHLVAKWLKENGYETEEYMA